MARDGKYGKAEFPEAHWTHFEDDEPIFVFRPQDNHTTEVLKFYRQKCVQSGAPQHHLTLIDLQIQKIKQWQRENFVQDPTSNSWLKAQTEDPSATLPNSDSANYSPSDRSVPITTNAPDEPSSSEDPNPNPLTDPNTDALTTTDEAVIMIPTVEYVQAPPSPSPSENSTSSTQYINPMGTT